MMAEVPIKAAGGGRSPATDGGRQTSCASAVSQGAGAPSPLSSLTFNPRAFAHQARLVPQPEIDTTLFYLLVVSSIRIQMCDETIKKPGFRRPGFSINDCALHYSCRA